MKRIGMLSLVILAMLLLTLAFSAAASPKAPAAAAAAAPANPAVAAPEPMPPTRVWSTLLEALRSAREHMAHAEGEFHGTATKRSSI